MSITLNLEELIEIAVNIELDGKNFYSAAAEFTTNNEAAELFQELAKWEGVHYETFKNLLEINGSSEFEQIIDPMNEAGLYLKAILGGDIFTKNETPQELAGDNPEHLNNIFRFALDREKDSIIFYSSLSKIYDNPDITHKIDIIIGEEISHIRFLHEARSKLITNF